MRGSAAQTTCMQKRSLNVTMPSLAAVLPRLGTQPRPTATLLPSIPIISFLGKLSILQSASVSLKVVLGHQVLSVVSHFLLCIVHPHKAP